MTCVLYIDIAVPIRHQKYTRWQNIFTRPANSKSKKCPVAQNRSCATYKITVFKGKVFWRSVPTYMQFNFRNGFKTWNLEL